MAERSQFDFGRVFRFLFREEVKTPLAFFFKVVPYLVAAWIAILYAPLTDILKYRLFFGSAAILVGLCLLVGIFAWFRPKHLVYGESGHRAEKKLEYGSDKRIIDEQTLELLERADNPKYLAGGTE